jgi:hypothetical protein
MRKNFFAYKLGGGGADSRLNTPQKPKVGDKRLWGCFLTPENERAYFVYLGH